MTRFQYLLHHEMNQSEVQLTVFQLCQFEHYRPHLTQQQIVGTSKNDSLLQCCVTYSKLSTLSSAVLFRTRKFQFWFPNDWYAWQILSVLTWLPFGNFYVQLRSCCDVCQVNNYASNLTSKIDSLLQYCVTESELSTAFNFLSLSELESFNFEFQTV